MTIKKYTSLGLLICISVLIPIVGFCATEDLDEMMARKSRIANASWGYEYLENPDGYVWQPESFCYLDQTSGNEVWRITGNIKDRVSGTAKADEFVYDLSESPFSADGKWIGFGSRRETAFPHNWGTTPIKWVVRPDGTWLRPMQESQNILYHGIQSPVVNWNKQVPDVAYDIGRSDQRVYKITVDENPSNSTSTALFELGSENGKTIKLNKTMSMDGIKGLAMTSPDWQGQSETWLFPLTLAEDGDKDGYGKEINDGGQAGIDNLVGYDAYNQRNLPCGNPWGVCPDSFYGYHDQFLIGAGDNLWFYFMMSGSKGGWWRMKLTGSAPDGGPVHTDDTIWPYSWGGQLEPANTVNYRYPDPWCGDYQPNDADCPGYWSHVHFDPWGRYATYSQSGGGGASDKGQLTVYDLETKKYVLEDVHGNLPVIVDCVHHAWNAWSDYTVYSTGGKEADSPYNLAIYQTKYNDESTLELLCATHSRVGGGTYTKGTASYESLPRPTQSPDGTKVLYHSTFFTSNDNDPNLFYVVANYPYPPQISSGVKNGRYVRIHFDFDEDNPDKGARRTYTGRGWPDEDHDPAPLPKEVTDFRLWVSKDNKTWTPIKKKSRLGTNLTKTDWYLEAIQPKNTVRYYGVTSIEGYSGLESRTLSNTWKITLDGNGNIVNGMGEQLSSYPSDPGGKSGFYLTQPKRPLPPTVEKMDAAGQYKIVFPPYAANENPMIRYINLYYSNNHELPPPKQKYRIASLPKDVTHWVDCLADPLKPIDAVMYTITYVDYQGNESEPSQAVFKKIE